MGIMLKEVFWNEKMPKNVNAHNRSMKSGLSIITSKSSSKNLRNENKQWCFCRLQDKI